MLPGSFEFALCHLVDKEFNLSALRSRFRNEAGGAPAFDPAVLLKIVLLAYSRGLVSSRAIEAAYRHNVLFMAVSGDSCPHFTTLAAFVAELGDEVAKRFAQVLVVCDRQGLIGRDLFAIDGVKLPSKVEVRLAVEALLLNAQHRKTGASRLCELKYKKGATPPSKRRKNEMNESG